MRDDEDAIELPDAGSDPDLTDGIDPEDDHPAPGKGIGRETPLGGI
jgi:hypothetical protein